MKKKVRAKLLQTLKSIWGINYVYDVISVSSMKVWMMDWEIDVVQDVIKELQPAKCLEWGTGGSTIFFTKRLPKGSRWVSVEHDRNWAIKIRRQTMFLRLLLLRGVVQIYHIQPNHTPWSDANGDGSYSDLKDYVDFPGKLGHFDFIFVDGRARKDCIKKACELVGDKGVVILHDAGRSYYHGPFDLYKYKVLLRDNSDDESGLWLASNGIDIKSLFFTKNDKRYSQYVVSP